MNKYSSRRWIVSQAGIRPVVSPSQPGGDTDLYRAAESAFHPAAPLFLSLLCWADPPSPVWAFSAWPHAPSASCAAQLPAKHHDDIHPSVKTFIQIAFKLTVIHWTHSPFLRPVSPPPPDAQRRPCARPAAPPAVPHLKSDSESASPAQPGPTQSPRLSERALVQLEITIRKTNTTLSCYWPTFIIFNYKKYVSSHLQPSHSGLWGFGSLSPAALCEFPPERAAAALRTGWSPGTHAPTCRLQPQLTHTCTEHFWVINQVWNQTYLKAASSSDSMAFSLSDAVSWTTRAALSRASSAWLRPTSSKATSFLWPSPLARLNSEPKEVTSPQSCRVQNDEVS